MFSLTSVKPLVYVQCLIHYNLLLMFNLTSVEPLGLCSVFATVEPLVYVQCLIHYNLLFMLNLTSVGPLIDVQSHLHLH